MPRKVVANIPTKMLQLFNVICFQYKKIHRLCDKIKRAVKVMLHTKDYKEINENRVGKEEENV